MPQENVLILKDVWDSYNVFQCIVACGMLQMREISTLFQKVANPWYTQLRDFNGFDMTEFKTLNSLRPYEINYLIDYRAMQGQHFVYIY